MSNFFKKIKELGMEQVVLEIKQDKEGKMTVFLTPKIIAKDSAFEKLKPLHVTGTPEELDEQYFDVITQPLQALNGIVSNVKEFEAQVQEVNKNTEANKNKKDKIKAAQESLKNHVKTLVTVDDWLREKTKTQSLIDAIFKIDSEDSLAKKTKEELDQKIAESSQTGIFEGVFDTANNPVDEPISKPEPETEQKPKRTYTKKADKIAAATTAENSEENVAAVEPDEEKQPLTEIPTAEENTVDIQETPVIPLVPETLPEIPETPVFEEQSLDVPEEAKEQEATFEDVSQQPGDFLSQLDRELDSQPLLPIDIPAMIPPPPPIVSDDEDDMDFEQTVEH